MIITNSFVFLHSPKTGGTFVTEVLKKVNLVYQDLNFQEIRRLKHQGVKHIPPEARKLPIVAAVRPPLEHYVSRYRFKWWCRQGKKEYRPDIVFKRYPNFPDLSFSDFLRYRCDWDVIPLSRIKDSIERERARDILLKGRVGFNSFELIDLISYHSVEIFANLDSISDSDIDQLKQNIIFLNQKTLSNDLYKLLRMYDVPGEAASIALDAGRIQPKFSPPKNVHDRQERYYSESDVAFVLDRDRFIFRMFKELPQAIELSDN